MTLKTIQDALKAIGRESDSELSKVCDHVVKKLDNGFVDINEALQILADHILNFDNAIVFKKHLSNVLLALVSMKIPLKPVFSSKNYDHCNDTEKTNHLEFSIVLALMSDHPDILQYTLKYFEINSVPPFQVFIHHEDSYNVAPKKRRLQSCRQKITDHRIVECCHTLLSKLPNELSSKWDWTKFVTNFSDHPDDGIRWLVKECMVILTNMTEAQSKILSKNLNLTDDDGLTLKFTDKIQCTSNEGDLGNTDLSVAGVVNIDGILLPIYDKSNVQDSKLVPVKSTVNNLRSLALAVASGKALSLMGPVGSGKTSLVEHLAAITGRKGMAFKKVQLGDQTDSRMLLGSHQCTDVPGEFVWRPGVLTEAVQNGHWLLLEDIDCAALDVASTLSSLLERNALCVPGYRDSLPVTPGFQLFVTQRTLVTNFGYQKKLSNSSTLLQKHLTQINVEPLSRSELSEIIHYHYPSLSTISSRMIEVFMMFSVGSHDTSLQSQEVAKESNLTILRGSRLISTRDLMKWCSRAVVGFNVTSAESALKVLQDALDIFTCSVSSPEHRLELAKKIGLCLGIVEAKTEVYFKVYKPVVSLTPRALEVGRAQVLRKEKSLDSINFDNEQVVFSFTRQSACLLERIACCVTANEPVLLVGETGTGKTSSVQYLAKQTGHKLVVINMNQQSDSADLLGGYKPVDMKYVIKPIKNEFENLFRSYYNVEKNKKFLSHIDLCYETENWNALLVLMQQSHKAAIKRLTSEKSEKRLHKWTAFGHKLVKLEQQVKAASRLTFAFIEGSLVKAMQEGYWVLLDEINLAAAEILECLAGLLEDKEETIDLLEKGDKVPIKRHPDFTLFACMNPATDVGKKDLPVGLRNRFTEFFIDELTERNDLILLIGDYLKHIINNGPILESIYKFYTSVKKEAKLSLVDGAGNAPHYSLRTLCRALTAAARANCGTVARSLYEAFCLSFLTQLDSSSHPKVEAMIAKAVIGKNVNSILKQRIPEPKANGDFLNFEGHWIPQGKLDIAIPEGYILTPTVKKNLRDIARIISLGRLPILLQGDTSVGKTSLITYIAKASGNYCVRINNHEHTDLQEYIGSYASDASGKLVFKEGVLVEAMRKGYWIILDELNLAPSDVLEALNRVLDDNRELFIPETQQVIKADPNFMLFATQNPPGLYGGRKMLSRAFRNRFVELHFDEIPRKELETILHQRCHVPPAYSKKMIAVMAELQVRRRGSAAVQGKDGFITLRDLFRWGQRYKHASKESLTDDKFYDWDQHIADEGYLILAGKVRQPDERKIIEDVIEKHIKRIVNPENLFSLHQMTSPVTKPILELILNNQLEEFSHVVWTYNMRRLAVLIAKAFIFNEPVLLVGETGCGKTTICQVLATLKKRQLLSVNCHMHTESSDFLGGLRPVRQYKNDGRLFEWVDGPLIQAMENGDMFLADEISLADDSVLERLNSLLEPERQLVLAERGTEEGSDIVVITADKDFHFIGTMNPGGDFGKKELSPALRNRFTEIWCDSVTSREDLLKVLEKSVGKGISLGNQEDGSSGIGNSILDFSDWLKTSEVANKFPFSIRDLLSWVQFVNSTVSKGLLDTPEAYVHGACMTFLDCFGTALTGHIDSETLYLVRKHAINFLLAQIRTVGNEYTESLRTMLCDRQTKFTANCDSFPSTHGKFGIHPFYIDLGLNTSVCEEQKFTFTAPTTGSNTLRLLRGLQLNKAILLEGNPGVGKTSLVTALAKSSGHNVVRINLSDQTDITDLFGTDLPSEDGSFAFKEGAFLRALQNGDWILLDELNLAPQPVLEGLNACLDHRGEVFIPELGRTFKVKPETRLFACQNPLKQGGARRGLPVSFLNRFTQVYIDTLRQDDLIYIVESQYPSLPKDVLHRIVKFNCKVAHEITEIQSWGHRGAPWEMNLRDIQRWCEALIDDQDRGNGVSPGKFVQMLYINRMRTAEDKDKMTWSYDEIFCPEYPRSDPAPQFQITDKKIIIGDVNLQRNHEKVFKNRRAIETNALILRNQLPALKALAQSVKMNWLSILVGPTATGKSSMVQVLADLTGNELQVVPVTSAMDVSDLLGGFEQVDYNRTLENLYDKIESLTVETVRNIWLEADANLRKNNKLLSQIHQYKHLQCNTQNEDNETENFNARVKFLLKHCEELVKHTKMHDTNWTKLLEHLNSLKNLQEKVSKASAINLGGKFEWVDSLLVKTMIEGSWILLDNVNLTSAAVLDRLNGLLEPNGTLSIPERGEHCEIRPHPNFRVFFTMDPKYGEISRAMRNRGVEIFLLRPDDWKTPLCETITHLDLVALVSSCGLPEQYHRICLECHELMTSFVQGFERPTLTHLLQASHLAWQQILRGIPYKTAIVYSFSDVYIKPRCGGDFSADVMTTLAEMKNNMMKALEQCLEKESDDLIGNSTSIQCKHTLTVKGLCLDSTYETTNLVAHPTVKQLTDYSKSLHVFLSIFTAYQKGSDHSRHILYSILKAAIQRGCHRNIIQDLNEAAYSACLSLKNDGYSSSEERFYPESNQTGHNIFESTAKTLSLFYDLSKMFIQTNLPKDSSSLTVMSYSEAVTSGALADEFDEYPILKHCQKYLLTIDRYIETILKSGTDKLDDEKSCRIIQLLNWRSRFLEVCSERIYVADTKGKKSFRVDEVVPLLYIHSKWVEKHLMGELFNVSSEDLQDSFENEVRFIKLDDQDNSKMAKIGKKLRKVYGQPQLYIDQEEFNSSLMKTNIYEQITLDMNQPLENQLDKFTFDFAMTTDMCLALDVPDSEVLTQIQENIAKIQESNKKAKSRPEIKLLPTTSYVILRLLSMLQMKFLKITSALCSGQSLSDLKLEESLPEVLNTLVRLGKVSKAFSPSLLNALQVIQKMFTDHEDIQQRISSLPVKFWEDFYNTLVYSPACYPEPFFNVASHINTEVVMELPVNTTRVSTNLPLMPYYVQKMTVSESLEGARQLLAYETVSLAEREQYSSQLGTVLNILWKNIGLLNTAAVSKVKSDAEFEITKYEQLTCNLHAIFTPVISEDSTAIQQNPIQLLKDYLKDDTSVVDMMIDANKVYKELTTVLEHSDQEMDKLKTKILTSELSLLTSLLFAKVMSEMSPVDHVEKYRLKAKYIKEDIEVFDALLSSYYMQGLVTGSITSTVNIDKSSDLSSEDFKDNREGLVKVHPYCRILIDMKEKTADRIQKYALCNTFRPNEPSYTSFVKDCKHFTKSVLSPKTTKDICSNLISTSEILYKNLKQNINSKTVLQSAQTTLKETASWLYSVNAFYKKIISIYSEAFPDIAKPLQCSVSQMVFSITCLNDLVKEIIAKIEQGTFIGEMVTDLMVYPSQIPNEGEKEKYMNRFVSQNFMGLLTRNITAAHQDIAVAEMECMNVLKMNLTELKMHCLAMERTDKESFGAVLNTLNLIVKVWEKQQRDIEKKKQDDEALYVTKSKCEDEDEEAMTQEEILEMFPTYSENDFGEFKPPTLEQKPTKATNTDKRKPNQLITLEDITLVYKWHSTFVKNLTNAEWLPSPKQLIGNDVISPFLERYPTFSRVIKNAWEALDADFEGMVSPSLMVLISQIKAKVDGEEYSGTKQDFYRSPWVSETQQCVPLIHKVKEATNALLEQWPDFPTLKDIMVIADRVLGFPVTSPITRFLTGLELLRDKIEEWNKNAHKGNNMIDISLAVGQQIINWRKLEMSHWRESLNNLYQRKQAEAHKYWFHLYSVVTSYLEPSESRDPVTPERVTTVLKEFMESSNLAQYEIRLDIVYVYHCHLVHTERSQRRDELLSILWNTYNFYSQFSAQVASRIKDKRAPIEKKLRDFVKICTWDRDLSYWSVKDTVEKAHKALHKHTKEFENVLKEEVAACLVDNTNEVAAEHVGIWDRPKRATSGTSLSQGGAYLIDPLNYLLLVRNVKKYLDQSEQIHPLIVEGSLLAKVPSLLNKAKTLCKDTITNSGYPSLVQALDDFVTMIIETSTHLGNLEVDSESPKDRQKSQAKNIVQQKRKALADLFKYLSKMGLNYRTGLVIEASSTNDNLYDFTIPPVDLDVAMSYLKSRRCDASLAQLWSGCERYFQKNIARHRLLTAALHTPHQDLGMQNIERCKGFAAHLLKLTNTQKKSISKYSRALCDLRTLTTNLTNALDVESDVHITTVPEKVVILTECYANASILLDQFSIVLKSCPDKHFGAEFEPDFDALLSTSPIVRCYKNSDEWKELNNKVRSLIASVKKQKAALIKVTNTIPMQLGKEKQNELIISQAQIDVSSEATDQLRKMVQDLQQVIKVNQFNMKIIVEQNIVPRHPILRSLADLSEHLTATITKLDNLNNSIDVPMEENNNELIKQTEDLVATILLIIQSVYKKHLTEGRENNDKEILNAIDEIIDDWKENVSSKDVLEDKHLKQHLQDNLSIDSKMLQLDSLINKLSDILKHYVQFVATNKEVDETRNAVMRVVPILEQMVLFVQYFVTQKVSVHRVSCKMLSVLLKIFSDLASKGFCKPSDLEMDDEDGEGGPGKLSSGTGLGEGEGQKDVSDNIENQDQLDDAKRPGEEKKEEDRDCKEEEKGVNMTDDFDSHLQDVDKKEGDNESDKEDEDDADKQMGDIDNAAEKLDQQIWGSEDEEDEPEEQGKKEKEEKGKGESTGEKEISAKDEEQGNDDGADGKDRKKQKDINEMDEPEVDDDHTDPYHGNDPQYPEPEDFDLPDNKEGEDEDIQDGETETENPFDIDVMKENITEEETGEGDDKQDDKDEGTDKNNGLDVSSDEDDQNGEQEQDKDDDTEQNEVPEKNEDEANPEKDNTEEDTENAEQNPENPQTENPQEENPTEKEDLPQNPDKIEEDDGIEEKKQEPNPQANPSTNDPTAENRAENAEMDRGTDDNVDTNAEQQKDEDTAPYEQAQEQVGEDKQSTGRSELDKSDKGHRGERQAASRADTSRDEHKKQENKPGKTDQERTLGEVNDAHKQSRTLNVEAEDQAEADGGENNDNVEKEADAYQHIKQGKEDDLQAIDAATKEQADQQPTLPNEEDDETEQLKYDDEIPMDVDDDDLQVDKSEELKPEKTKDGADQQQEKAGNKNDGDDPTGETGMEVEGENVLTSVVPRGNETTYHTKLDNTQSQQADEISLEQYMSIREWLTSGRCGQCNATGVWRTLWQESSGAARALCERLRLVLEPTGRSRRAGDFRTGRAINMRRVIPYIASHFRKDRIWLRRTKPAKREYKIAIAVDDSSSMADNRSKELAFESLALVSQALNLLESGDLAVLSFGEKPNLLHPFTEQFSEHSGSKILEQLRFDQTKTKIAQLLDFCTVLFDEQSNKSDALNAKLLVVVSDGRGIFSEGETRVIQAVRRARQQGIFLVYVIIDNPDNKDSIMDIRRPLFEPITNTMMGFVQYLDTFPFPFYLILRDMSALPTVLGDALRQWFELAANIAS